MQDDERQRTEKNEVFGPCSASILLLSPVASFNSHIHGVVGEGVVGKSNFLKLF